MMMTTRVLRFADVAGRHEDEVAVVAVDVVVGIIVFVVVTMLSILRHHSSRLNDGNVGSERVFV